MGYRSSGSSRGYLYVALRSIAVVMVALSVALVGVDVAVQTPFRGASSDVEGHAAGAVTVSVSPQRAQRWMGFGASGAWWSGPVAAFAPSRRAYLGKLLFSSSGLELSQFRYNIGGGGYGVLVPWKADPSMYTPSGQFNWNGDPAGVLFLKMAHEMGVKDLIGFVNSAPPQFTSDHLSCAGSLLGSQVQGYATYLARLVQGLWVHDHIKLSYVSPMNEPANSFPSCKQEGMAVPVALRGPLVVDLGTALERWAPWCRITADESSQVSSQMLKQLPEWVTPGVLPYLSVVAHHDYDFPTSAVFSRMKAYVSSLHRPSWTSEICCYQGARFGYQYDPTMSSGLWLADLIYHTVTFGGDSAFQWWIAASPDVGCDVTTTPSCANQVNVLGRNDGLVYFDLNGGRNGDQRFFLTKRYWVFAGFSRYIRPGAIIHLARTDDASIHAITAYANHVWTVVVINEHTARSGPTTLQIQFPPHTMLRSVASSIVTSPTSNAAPSPKPQVNGSVVVGSIAPSSVTTYQFSS
ncbi:MAG: glycoside hydrolase [Acidimicrobiales bacterium]